LVASLCQRKFAGFQAEDFTSRSGDSERGTITDRENDFVLLRDPHRKSLRMGVIRFYRSDLCTRRGYQ
jgi:hypothetical protein